MKIPRSLLIVSLATLLLALPSAAHAQATKLFVASFGNDANDGSRGAPKRNFQAAHDGLLANGEIVVLDTAGYGAVTINKALTITCPSGVAGLISASGAGTTAMTVSIAASATVALRGLTIENVGSANNGILFNSAGTLDLSDCTLQGFVNYGVQFTPNASAALIMGRCTVRNSGARGVNVAPTGGSTVATATLADCRFDSNQAGLIVVGAHFATVSGCVFTSGFRGIELQNGSNLAAQGCTLVNHASTGFLSFGSLGFLQDCTISGNTNSGVFAQDSGGAVVLKRCNVSLNTNGIVTNISGVVRVDDCVISGNSTTAFSPNGGTILSRGNNTISNNAATGSFGTYTAQ